jgi:hypothetical protein
MESPALPKDAIPDESWELADDRAERWIIDEGRMSVTGRAGDANQAQAWESAAGTAGGSI